VRMLVLRVGNLASATTTPSRHRREVPTPESPTPGSPSILGGTR
jgi:hypothetical protein